MLGSWDINISKDFPQKIATAVADLNNLVGAEYNPIAYIGSQVVNGTNHAVLCEQTIVAGKDTKNIVMVFFRETKEGVTLTNIERVVEDGGDLGGIKIDVKTTIPDDANSAFVAAFDGFVGSKIEPFALLATQMTKGVNYTFAAKVTPVVKDPTPTVALVTVNGMTLDVAFVDLLESKNDVMTLGYAFTWLRKHNTSAGRPVSEMQ